MFRIARLIHQNFDCIGRHQFDCVVYDSHAVWGAEISDRPGCPKIALVTSHLINQSMIDTRPGLFVANFCNG